MFIYSSFLKQVAKAPSWVVFELTKKSYIAAISVLRDAVERAGDIGTYDGLELLFRPRT